VRWRSLLVGLTVLLALLASATARLFIWPAAGVPNRVNAVLLPAGPGAPLSTAVRLARVHHAEFLLVSQGHEGYGGPCPRPVPGIRLICFDPDPATTQGEAEFAGRLARKYHWQSILLVTITPQVWRARQRMQRCFSGSVYATGAGIAWSSWPYQIAYEWGATVKMLVFQRAC
jgi:hypothetical protein